MSDNLALNEERENFARKIKETSEERDGNLFFYILI